MVVDLIGIVDGGGPRDPNLPLFAQKQINMVSGSSVTVRISVFREDGTPIPLAADPSLLLTLAVSRSSYDYAPIPQLKKQASLAPLVAPNAATFAIIPSDTKFLPPGRYVFAVWMTYQGVRDAVVPLSPFVIEPAGLLP